MAIAQESLARIEVWLRGQAQECGIGPDASEDLASEVILRLLVASARCPIESPLAYARTILKNLVRDRIRQMERASKALEEFIARSRSSVGPDEGRVDRSDLVAHLLETSGLTAIQSQVIRLIYLEGLSLAGAAERLSRNPGTIHRHRERALEKLSARAALLRILP